MPSKKIIVQEKIFRGQYLDPQISYATGIPLPDPLADMVEAYLKHPWVYKAIAHIAADYASVPIEILKQQSDGSTIPETTNLFTTKLFAQPNPFMSFYDVQELTAIALECDGNAYWGLERGPNGEPTELWPLPPDKVRAISSKTNLIERYVLDVGGNKIYYDPNDIIHQKYASPFSMIYGQGSIAAARQTIMTDLFSERWNQMFFRNSARPDAIIEMDRTIQPSERKRMIQAWRQMYGGTANAKKLAILEKGSKYVPINTSHEDMEFIELRKQAREIIIGSIGVPPSVLGILEFANFANMREQTQVYWKYTMLPKIRRRDQTLTMRIRQLLFRNDLIAKTDLTSVEPLRDDELTRSAVIRRYWDMGIPLNVLIDTFELPFEHVEGGDKPRPNLGGGAGEADKPSSSDSKVPNNP